MHSSETARAVSFRRVGNEPKVKAYLRQVEQLVQPVVQVGVVVPERNSQACSSGVSVKCVLLHHDSVRFFLRCECEEGDCKSRKIFLVTQQCECASYFPLNEKAPQCGEREDERIVLTRSTASFHRIPPLGAAARAAPEPRR